MSLIEKALGNRDPILNLEYDEAFNEIFEILIPDILNIDLPKKPIEKKA